MKNRSKQVYRGPVKKARYTQSDITADQLLTEVSIAYYNDNRDGFAHTIFPSVPVDEETGRYFEFSRDELLRTDAQKRRPKSPFARKDLGVTQRTYTCEQTALEIPLGDEESGTAASPLDEQAMAVALTEDLVISRELDFWSTYITPTSGVWGAYEDGSNDFVQWNANTGTRILQNVDAWHDAVKQGCGFKANTILMSKDVFNAARNDSAVKSAIFGGGTVGAPSLITASLMAQIFDVDRVVVADAVYNSAAEGLSYSGGFFGTERFWIGYVSPTPSKLSPSAGYSFSWTGLDSIDANSGLGGIERYRDETIRSDVFRGTTYYAHEVVASGAGLLAFDVLGSGSGFDGAS